MAKPQLTPFEKRRRRELRRDLLENQRMYRAAKSPTARYQAELLVAKTEEKLAQLEDRIATRQADLERRRNAGLPVPGVPPKSDAPQADVPLGEMSDKELEFAAFQEGLASLDGGMKTPRFEQVLAEQARRKQNTPTVQAGRKIRGFVEGRIAPASPAQHIVPRACPPNRVAVWIEPSSGAVFAALGNQIRFDAEQHFGVGAVDIETLSRLDGFSTILDVAARVAAERMVERA